MDKNSSNHVEIDYGEGLVKAQGLLHEISACQTTGGDAVRLDEIAGKGFRGGHFPTYDISSSTEIASVKSHLSGGPQLTDQDLKSYKNDFNHMMGLGRAYSQGLSPVQQDAQNIAYLRDSGLAPIPSEIAQADEEEITSYLQSKSVLRIPDDHVEAVQNMLAQDARLLPANFGLPENPSNEELLSVIDRVRGTGLSSAQTVEHLNQQSLNGRSPETGTSQSESVLDEDTGYDYGLYL